MALAFAPSSEAASSPPPNRFETLRADDLRVASVGYRLSIANAARCTGVITPQLGFVLHSIDQYGLKDREEASRSFGLGRNVGVMAVVGSSPAQKGGLAAGDQLLAINGRTLSSDESSVTPSRASVDFAQAALFEAMQQGQVTLRVSRSGGEREIRFTAAVGCPSDVELIPDDAVNAWADGSRVMVSEGLLRRCATDGDLALVLGHEMAHNLLHHRERLAAEGSSANGLLPLTTAGSRAMRQTEEEADRLAVTLATTAAYDLSTAETFMSGLLAHTLTTAATHPAPDRRLALLRSAIASVVAMRHYVPAIVTAAKG
jgi:hypothetical protein